MSGVGGHLTGPCSRCLRADVRKDWTRPYKKVIVDFFRRQPGAALIEDDINDYVDFLDDPDFVSQQRRKVAFWDERAARKAGNYPCN